MSTLTIPSTGQIARVRTRHWLVGSVHKSPHGTLVELACVDDDAQGETLEVVWEVELDALVLDEEAWSTDPSTSPRTSTLSGGTA